MKVFRKKFLYLTLIFSLVILFLLSIIINGLVVWKNNELKIVDKQQEDDPLLKSFIFPSINQDYSERNPLTFNNLYTDNYLDSLSYFQDKLIASGYIKEEDRLELNSADNVFSVLKKILDYLKITGNISSERYEEVRRSLETSYQQIKSRGI